jgi:hypothetical protein
LTNYDWLYVCLGWKFCFLISLYCPKIYLDYNGSQKVSYRLFLIIPSYQVYLRIPYPNLSKLPKLFLISLAIPLERICNHISYIFFKMLLMWCSCTTPDTARKFIFFIFLFSFNFSSVLKDIFFSSFYPHNFSICLFFW